MSTPQSYNKVDSASPLNAKDSAVKANIEALADLFPAAVQEGVVDFDALTRILGGKTEPQPERFGLNWCGKAAAHAGALVDSAGTLRPCREESKDWDTTKNLYIEGDNLEVLKLLRNSYRGKVKMIYIDPPYNTGKDFVYKDNFHDSIKNYQQITDQQNELKENSETSGRYHTDWLNMMYPRLMLARELLREDGVIFISIDEREFSNLYRIVTEIFGEDNYIGEIIWKNKFGAGAKTKGFIGVHEYILTVSKKGVVNLNRPLTLEEQKNYNKNKDSKFSYRGGFVTQPLAVTTFDERPSLIYPVFYKGQEIWPNTQWVWCKDRLYQAIENDEVVFNLQEDGSYNLRSKKYLIDENGNMRRGKPTTFYNDAYTQNGTNDIRCLFDNKVIFDYTKPVELLKYLLSFEVDENIQRNGIILDFFSGSASTAQAVMQLNAEDGGNRHFIMVQLPEPCTEKSEAHKAGYKNICEIGKERIRRAGEKVKTAAGDKARDLDIGFRVYKLDSSNVNAWDPETNDIEKSLEQAANHLKEERNAEDIMTELMLRFGIMLTNNIEKEECGDTGLEVYNIGCGRHFACLDERLAAHAEEVAHFILEWHKEENPGTHEEEAKDCQVFVVDKAFVGNDAAKKNFCAILSDYGIKQVNAF